ncbi:MAG: formate dehydrogenase subunit alpha [Gemmatimonadota bacterium]|nr:formate dehydrogenase subunit alpha [Gemmatimonadota bacterium]
MREGRTGEGAVRRTATIDGRSVPVGADETILEAARRAGLEIPTLCWARDLSPQGGCRLCVVEVEGRDRPVAACHSPLGPEMVVTTDTERLRTLRRDLLRLYLDAAEGNVSGARAPAPDGGFPAGTGSEFEALLEAYGLRPTGTDSTGPVERSHPYLRFDPALCVACFRCLLACEEVQGQFVYGAGGRGPSTRLLIGTRDRFAESGCVACGACVDRCPTGAVFDRDRETGRDPERVVETVCGYCGVGCRVAVAVLDGEVARIDPVEDAAVNRNHLCVKGRYAHAWHRSPDRLTTPRIRDGDGFREASWDEALDAVAEGLGRVRESHGPDALAALTSSRSTNEANYLLQRLFREVLGTNHVDCCARVCHASTALALAKTTGTGAASASYVDLERAERIVVAGANPTEAHPVVGARIKEAALAGATLVVIDPREIELARYADLHLPVWPGTNVALFDALAKLLLEEEGVDRPYLEERCENLDELEAFVATLSVAAAAETSGVDEARIRAAAGILAGGPTLFVHGLGLSELWQGTASVEALVTLGMLTGSIGRPGAGMLPLRGQNNVQGNADMGAMPDRLTGYQVLDDPEVRARVREVWGAAPPEAPGLTIPEMFDAAVEGRVRAMWMQGEDVAQSDPYEAHVIEALESLDFLVVQELFMTETARRADVVLPAAGYLENEGTFTNGERRIQRVRRVVDPPGEARTDWEVVEELARRMGADWDHADPASVMDEIARVAPALFGGVSYARLDGDGLQWPCPAPDHPGTETVHAEGFLRGEGRLAAAPHRSSPEHDVEGYPYLLNTGRVLDHYNVGTMTRRTPQADLVGDDRLEINPDDAAREGVAAGDPVTIESRWGRTTVPAEPTDRVKPGTLFLSFHFPESHANAVTGPCRDPESNCPQYKATAVRITRSSTT